ncbi:sulfatase [Olivibacter sp. SDN3]|uniref:sulfatase family protein n=1 Tax=Olivibacter sp. SDN3 TaxID=2764720 RepID=UPI0016515B9A|nr:sulfatase [Olivibacter sp. SDN3]QNL48266.1 sulfatase [Olivibacter sp. SDN3]
MKKIICYLLLCWLMAGCKESAQEKPNIVFVLADDISWDDIGCYGNQAIRTPHIDQLAQEGLQFTNFYVTSSSCSPSRTSILTGRYPHNTGAAELHTELPAELSYFPELLKNAGYFSALVGKWHEGENTRRAYDTLLVDKKINGEGGEEQWISLLQNRPKDRPFVFWLAPYDAHRDWSDDDQFSKPYKPEEVRVPPTLLDTEETRKDLASYYNEITRLDAHIGKLREELHGQGITENTIVIFMADNARPFPGSKTRLLDRGTRTPFLICWPKGIAHPGKSVDALVSSIDIAPTLLKLSGVEVAESFQGESFATLLDEPDKDFRQYIFTEHNWHDYEAYERAVRTKDFLYIRNERPQYANEGPIDANQSPSAKALKDNLHLLNDYQVEALKKPRSKEEFFNNKEDHLQEFNLIDDPAYGGEIDELRKVLKRWQEDTGDSLPQRLTPDWYDRNTGQPLPEKNKRGEMPGASKVATKVNKKGPF